MERIAHNLRERAGRRRVCKSHYHMHTLSSQKQIKKYYAGQCEAPWHAISPDIQTDSNQPDAFNALNCATKLWPGRIRNLNRRRLGIGFPFCLAHNHLCVSVKNDVILTCLLFYFRATYIHRHIVYLGLHRSSSGCQPVRRQQMVFSAIYHRCYF